MKILPFQTNSRFASGNPESDGHFLHPQALVESGAFIGKGTRVWAFAHVSAGAIIGEECNICDHTFIESGVRIANRVTIKCGVFLWNGLTIGHDVFIGPGAVFTNDYRPRSQRHLKTNLKTLLKEGCSIGANSTILPNLAIGRWAMVGAGAVVTRSVPDYALVVGSPARFRAWVCRCGEKLPFVASRVLKCQCGRMYEQAAKTELKEVVTNGHQPAPMDHRSRESEAAIVSNGHSAGNGD